MINNIRLINWRNFKDLKLDFKDNNLIIFLGANAVGKTSILEAIYYLSTTKSHRTTNISSLINYNSDEAIINLNYDNKQYKANLSKDGKNFFINNIKVKSIDFACEIKTIFFSPYDLILVNGIKEDKRKFLDLNISFINKNYLNNLMLYKKVLKKRNELLKNKNLDLPLIKVLTNNLINYTKIINECRYNYINKINYYLNKITKDLNILGIKLSNEIIKDNIVDMYNKSLKNDIYYKTTTVGPHRDGFNINIGDKDLKTYGSQGQIRLAIIAIKLAIYEIVKENYNPILLLDDVFAELDYQKQVNLVNYLNNYQTFITTTTLIEIPNELLKKALIIKL